jgi:hypothetical protein
MDMDDLYTDALEALTEELGREPNDQEIGDWVADRISAMIDDAYERAREAAWE